VYERESESAITAFEFAPWSTEVGGESPSFAMDLKGGGDFQAGTPLLLSFFAAGEEPIYGFWYKDDEFYSLDAGSGAGFRSLGWEYVDATNAGAWYVVLSNSNPPMATSSIVAVTVSEDVAPVIAAINIGSTNLVGTDVILTVIMYGGTVPFAYQWTFDGSEIAGETGAYLTISDGQESDSGDYAVVVTNVAGSVTSAVVTVDFGEAPSITTQPTNVTAVLTNYFSFSVVASGYEPFFYQWRLNGNNCDGGDQLQGYTNLAWPSVAGSYDCVVSNALGAVTSDAAVLTVTIPVLPVAPHPYLRMLLN